MALKRINEGSARIVTVRYLLGTDAVTPSAASYNITCLTTGRTVTSPEWVTYTPSGTSDSLSIPAAYNRILDQSNRWERKQLTVKADPDTPTQFTKSYDWIVENRRGIE